MAIKQLRDNHEWIASYCPEVKVDGTDTILVISGRISEGCFKEIDVPIGSINKVQLGCDYKGGNFSDSRNETSFNLENVVTDYSEIELKPFTDLISSAKKKSDRNVSPDRTPYYIVLTNFENPPSSIVKKIYIPCYTVLNNMWLGSSKFYKALFKGESPDRTMFNRNKSAALVNGECGVYLNKEMLNSDRHMIAYIAHNAYTSNRAQDIYKASIGNGVSEKPSLKAYPPFKMYKSIEGEGVIRGDALWVSFITKWDIGDKKINKVSYGRPGDSGDDSKINDQGRSEWVEKIVKPDSPDKNNEKDNKSHDDDFELSPNLNEATVESSPFFVASSFDEIISVNDSQNENHINKKKKIKEIQKECSTDKSTREGDRSGELEPILIEPPEKMLDRISQLKKVLNDIDGIEWRTSCLGFNKPHDDSDMFYLIFPDDQKSPDWMKYKVRNNGVKTDRTGLCMLFEIQMKGRYFYLIEFEPHVNNIRPSTLSFYRNNFNSEEDSNIRIILSSLSRNEARRDWINTGDNAFEITKGISKMFSYRRIKRYKKNDRNQFELESNSVLKNKILGIIRSV